MDAVTCSLMEEIISAMEKVGRANSFDDRGWSEEADALLRPAKAECDSALADARAADLSLLQNVLGQEPRAYLSKICASRAFWYEAIDKLQAALRHQLAY